MLFMLFICSELKHFLVGGESKTEKVNKIHKAEEVPET